MLLVWGPHFKNSVLRVCWPVSPTPCNKVSHHIITPTGLEVREVGPR